MATILGTLWSADLYADANSSLNASMTGMLSAEEQVPKMEQPRADRFTATARPMPRDAPVTRANLPARSCGRMWNAGVDEDWSDARG